jgi:hypothetical protein
MGKSEETTNTLDTYREVLTETRLKVLAALESSIKSEALDSIEALNKLAAITLLPRPVALKYARALGQPELWKRAE